MNKYNMTDRPFWKEIDNHWKSYEAKSDDALYKGIYDFLICKHEWELIEYNFLCWLNYVKNYEVKFNTPIQPKIVERSITEFQRIYASTDKRVWLNNLLGNFVEKLKTHFKLKHVDLLVGGSFTDLEINEPNDIDFIVLTEPNADATLHETFLYASKFIPDKIDVKFLPENYSFEVYKAYTNIFTLGNKVKEKEELISNNHYTQRILLKLRF